MRTLHRAFRQVSPLCHCNQRVIVHFITGNRTSSQDGILNNCLDILFFYLKQPMVQTWVSWASSMSRHETGHLVTGCQLVNLALEQFKYVHHISGRSRTKACCQLSHRATLASSETAVSTCSRMTTVLCLVLVLGIFRRKNESKRRHAAVKRSTHIDFHCSVRTPDAFGCSVRHVGKA